MRSMPMHPGIEDYNESLESGERRLCERIARLIEENLDGADGKVWHGHPVWFLDGNPIVGYSRQKDGIRLMFWSGADFDEPDLGTIGKKFKDASIFFNDISEIDGHDIIGWLQKAKSIQWDYKNLVKRKGRLEKLV